jgi:sigma-E factor negative regulatory protein RseB
MAVIMTAIFVSTSAISQQNRVAYDLVDSMIEASNTLNYLGLVTYEKEGRLKTSKMLHLIRDDMTFEQLTHLDGPAGQISWRRTNGNCGMERAWDADAGSRPILNEDSFGRIKASYSFEIRGQSRVAGREATTIILKPKDKFRLPHFVAIDNQSNLMLMSVILSLSGKPLERFQFVEIEVGGELDTMLMTNSQANLDEQCVNAFGQQNQGEWNVGFVPSGFFLTNSMKESLTGQTVLGFSDGLTTFTVFIESAQMSAKIPPFTYNHGATAAVSTKIKVQGDEYTVSIVGEIPADGAKKIAQSVKQASKILKQP